MSGRTILNIEAPTTQSIASVKALLGYVGRGCDPLPTDVSLENGRMVLILSNKKDCYYVTTACACSCPAATFQHNAPCKHQRKYFAEVKAATKPATTDSLIKRGGFKPIDKLPGEERAAKASSSLSPIDCHDTTDLDVAYHSIREDRILWPLEA
jgi:hypothetical protein